MEKKHLAGSIICGVLTAFGIVAVIISLLGGSNGIWVLDNCVLLVLYGMIIFYAFVGYKKPHGNLLKYIILIYATHFLIAIDVLAQVGNVRSVILYTVIIGLMCYMAGRLVKVKENMIFIIIIAACLAVDFVSDFALGMATIGAISPFVSWLVICVAYFLRYKEHKEAGLMDVPKK